MNDFLKNITAIVVMAVVFSLAFQIKKHRDEVRHSQYIKCVNGGVKPELCSFQVVFGNNNNNEVLK